MPQLFPAGSGNLNLAFSISDPDKQGQLTIRDFLFRGDYVNLTLDLTNNRPLSMTINSYLNTAGVPVTLSVTFGSLYGSAAFVREAVFVAKEMDLKISVQNSDFHKIAP